MANSKLTPPTKLFAHYNINDDSLGDIDYHLTLKKLSKTKPLLIWCDGSGCDPVVTIDKTNSRKIKYRVSIFIKMSNNILSDYHIVVISKPGISFSKTIKKASPNLDLNDSSETDCNKDYHSRLTLDWRAKAVVRVINDIKDKNEIKIRNNKIIVAGHSEGANVAAMAGTLDSSITHIGCFSSVGMTQYYDFIIEQRKAALIGTISPEEAQKKIDELIVQIKKISNAPNAPNKFWKGHSFKRWSSFTAQPMANLLLQLDCNIYAVNSSEDKNAMCETMDILPILFAQKNRTNLTFKTYIGYDHWYNRLEEGDLVSCKDEVFDEFFLWLTKN